MAGAAALSQSPRSGPYRILLVAATGHAPEEVTTLTIDDVELLPSGIRLTLTKRRAQRVRHRTFAAAPADPVSSEPVDYTDRPHREVAAIIRRLIQATDRVRGRTPGLEHLFVAASVSVDGELRFACWNYNLPRSRLGDWLATANVVVDGPPDIRRLRKSTKVEKALAFGGRIADAANDHHQEVFRGHYAQGTTLRVMSGQVITTAQHHWFAKAVDGPTVLTDSTVVLDTPEQASTIPSTSRSGQPSDKPSNSHRHTLAPREPKALLQRELDDVTLSEQSHQGATMTDERDTNNQPQPSQTVSDRTAKRLRDAMERLLAGRPNAPTDG